MRRGREMPTKKERLMLRYVLEAIREGEYLKSFLTIMKMMIRTMLFVIYNALTSSNGDSRLYYIFVLTTCSLITEYGEICH